MLKYTHTKFPNGTMVYIGDNPTPAKVMGVDYETGKLVTEHKAPEGTTIISRIYPSILRSVTVAILLVATLLGFSQHAAAQINGDPMPFVKPQFFDNGGKPAAGYKLCTYAAGTNNPLRTYTTSALSVPNTNPLILDSAGRAGIFLSPIAYKVTLLTDKSTTIDCLTGSMVTVWTQDNIADLASLLKVSLATTTGAGLIGFSQTATYPTGTVGTDLQQIRVNVKSQPFNATGDGSTSDDAAIQLALAYVLPLHGTLYFPCGTYLFSTEITISSRIDIEGDGFGQSTGLSKPCTILKKTADVIGIHINSGVSHVGLRNFQLTSSASTGTSDGIVVGDIDGSGGSSEDDFRNLVVDHHKGSGINVRNGLSGVMDHVVSIANVANGILLNSLNTSFGNVNAWRLISITSGGNSLDGLRMGTATANTTIGVDIEGNGRYGIYANSPYNIFIGGDLESNATNSIYFDTSCFDCWSLVHDNSNTPHQGNTGSFMFNLAGTGNTPALEPTTGRFAVRGSLSTAQVFPVYGPTVVINYDLGNTFEVDVTDGANVAIDAPSSLLPSLSDTITIIIKNTSGGVMGTTTWSFVYHLAAWTNPANGFSRSITFHLDPNTSRWTEVGRTPADVPN